MIKDIFVLSSKRRRGYGKDILNHIEKIHPGYSYCDKTTTTVKGDRFFHKVKESPIFYPENKYQYSFYKFIKNTLNKKNKNYEKIKVCKII